MSQPIEFTGKQMHTGFLSCATCLQIIRSQWMDGLYLEGENAKLVEFYTFKPINIQKMQIRLNLFKPEAVSDLT